MNKEELKKLSLEELKKKKKNTKTLMIIFVPLILSLAYFSIEQYVREGQLDWPLTTITICTVGGLVALFPEWKAIQEELNSRA